MLAIPHPLPEKMHELLTLQTHQTHQFLLAA